jgi:deoxyribodipyrimidine photo-lyase
VVTQTSSGPSAAIVLFTRDLRVHDHPALVAASSAARVVPLFVLDDAILSRPYAAPNRLVALLEALADLRASLRALGSDLVVRRGRPAAVVAELLGQLTSTATGTAAGTGAAGVAVHCSADVSAFARAREAALARVAADAGASFAAHPGVMLVDPHLVRATGGGHFKVFTPYWRRWSQVTPRPVLGVPDLPPLPAGLDAGAIPELAALSAGTPAPMLQPSGERAARARLAWWMDGPVEDYAEGRNRMAEDATSRLSVPLHLGCLSVTEVAAGLNPRRAGHVGFLQELCWRDFNHQLLDARPDLAVADVRTKHDRWRVAPDELAAWQEGRTGYPVVDAGMRQLLAEGWMHNRARMVTASFLTKHLYIDWREGARHFLHHLADGDLANNFAQWQWTAGTGTDSRPNRMFNPVVQGERYDPDGAYVRRWVPELMGVAGRAVHQPRAAPATLFDVAAATASGSAGSDTGPQPGAADYPAPIVDHRAARERFLTARGALEE